MSYPPAAPAPNRKTFTPAIIAALGALVVLAIITVIVVSRSPSDGTSADPPASTSTDAPSSSASTSDAPSDNGVPSDDGAFTYLPPADFETDPSETLYVAYVTNAAVVNSPNSDESTSLTVSSIEAPGQSLDVFTSGTLDDTLDVYDTAETATPIVADIDGEPTSGLAIPAYTSGTGTSIALDKVLVVREGVGYQFTALYPAASQTEARAAFTEFLNSVTWT